jgi:hypothetical protein
VGAAIVLPRWAPAAALLGVGAALQLGALGAVLTGRARLAGSLAALSLGPGFGVLGLLAHAGLHLSARFGPDAARTGLDIVALSIGLLPWAIGFPLVQALRHRRAGAAATLAALAVLLPAAAAPLAGTVGHQRAPAAVDPLPLAAAAWAHATGAPAPALPPTGPVQLLVTAWSGGVASASQPAAGPDAASALAAAVAALPPAPDAVVVDVLVESWASGLVPEGTGGHWALAPAAARSPSALWRPRALRRHALAGPWGVPQPSPPSPGARPARFASAIAGPTGAARLGAGWSAPPPLGADTVREAALAGARHLVANLDADGRFTYEVKGPSGEAGRGYNLPRHAGTTWFLARAAQRSGDPALDAAARRALAWMKDRSTALPDGRAYLADGRRSDGVAWVGTTALAVLAAVALDDPIAAPWGDFVASAVDARGQVRGEASRATGDFAPQPQNPYGHGQSQLALAALARAGHPGAAPALARAAAFFDGPYAPLGADRLVPLDEHWSCIAAAATAEAIGTPGGWSLCRAYLAAEVHPAVAGGFRPAAGPAGGVAEAVVAAALLDPTGPYAAAAQDYGRLFLDAAYRAADAPFLGRPARLIGGFRDSPGALDVRIDTVQHIGCALLGLEELLSGVRHPGSRP